MRKFPFWLLIVLIAWIIFGAWYWHCVVHHQCGCNYNNVAVENIPKVPFKINGAGFNTNSKNHFSFTKNGSVPRIPFETSQAIDKLEDFLAVNPNVSVNVEGQYRNFDLKPDGYKNLGFARAANVKDELVRRGYRANQITTSSKVVNAFTEYKNRIIGGANFTLTKTAPPVIAKAPKPKPVAKPVAKPKPAPKPKPIVKKVVPKKPAKKLKRPGVQKKPVLKNGLAQKAVDFTKAKVADFKKGQRIELKNVQFASGSSQLQSKANNDLNRLYTILTKNKNINIEVGGYTDNTGSLQGNEKLSKKRAESVKSFLISKGIKANRISSNGYGPALPVADNKTTVGRAANRRVEIKIK